MPGREELFKGTAGKGSNEKPKKRGLRSLIPEPEIDRFLRGVEANREHVMDLLTETIREVEPKLSQMSREEMRQHNKKVERIKEALHNIDGIMADAVTFTAMEGAEGRKFNEQKFWKMRKKGKTWLQEPLSIKKTAESELGRLPELRRLTQQELERMKAEEEQVMHELHRALNKREGFKPLKISDKFKKRGRRP